MHHPVSPLRALRRRAAKTTADLTLEPLEGRIAPAFVTGAYSANSVTLNGDASADSITLTVAGTSLSHSALAGFNSNIDWDSTQAGDQTISVLTPFAVTINGNGGDDTVQIGTPASPAISQAKGTFTINLGTGAADTLIVDDTADATGRTIGISATQVAFSGGPTINYANLQVVNITAGIGADTFNVSGTAANVTYSLSGNVGADLLAVTANGDFALSDTSLGVTATGFGAIPVGLSGLETANLTGGTGANSFTVGGWSGPATIDGQGGNDTLKVTNDVTDLGLTDTQLTRTGLGTLTLASIEVANLTGGPGANNFTVSNWSGVANLDGGGNGADQFIVNLAALGSSTVSVTGGAGADALIVNGTSGDDHFVVNAGSVFLGAQSVFYNAPLDSVTVDGKGGNDPLQILVNQGIASPARSFTYIGGGQAGDTLSLSGLGSEAATWIPGAANAGSVDIGGAVYHYSSANGGLAFSYLSSLLLQPGAGADDYTLNGAAGMLVSNGAAQSASLAAIPSLAVNFGAGDGPNIPVSDTFTVNGLPLGVTSLDVKLGSGTDHLNISGLTTLAGITFTANGGATGTDTISFTGDVDVTLSDTALTIPGGSIALGQFEDAVLIGGLSGNKYTVTDWTGTGSIDGMGGTDTLVATNDEAAIGLSDTAFTRSNHGTFTLAHLEAATLTGGAGDNAFTISSYTGSASVSGGSSGSDSLDLTAATGLTMTLLNSTDSTITYNTSTISASAIGTYTLHGNGLGLIGDSQATVTWKPPVTGNAGPQVLDILENNLQRTITSDGLLASITNLSALTLQTPAGADAITLGSDGQGYATISGGVGGPNSYALSTSLQGIPSLTFDLGANDATGGAADTITINSLSGEIALTSLTLKTGEGDDVITFANSVQSLNLNGAGGGISIDLGAGIDQIVANAPSTDLGLSTSGGSSLLTYGSTSGLSFTGVERFDLTARTLSLSGADNETVAWSVGQDVVQNTALGAQAGSLAAPGSFFGTVVYHLDSSTAAPLTIDHIYTLNLTTPASNTPSAGDTFTLDAGANNGEVTLTGTVGNGDAHGATLSNIAVLGIDLGAGETAAIADQLTVKSLALAGLTTLTVKTGTGADTLELDSTLTDLALGSNPGEGFSFDGGGGADTIELTSSSAINLGPATLAIGNGGALSFSNAENFVLDAGPNGQVNYTGDGTEAFIWFPDSSVTQHGTAGLYSKNLDYTGQLGIFNTASLFVETPAGADSFTLSATATLGKIDGTVSGATAHHAIFSGIPTLTLDLAIEDGMASNSDALTVTSLSAPGLTNFTLKTGAGDDKLTLASALTNLKTSTWDAGTGHDTLEATADVSMALADGLLIYADNQTHTTIFGTLTLAGSAVEEASLTGGASGNTFRFNGWSGKTTVKAGDGNDTIDFRGGFTGTGSFGGEGNDDTFILQSDPASTTTKAFGGGLGGASLDGGSGTDTIQVQANLDLTLTDASLVRTIPKTKTTPAQSITNTLMSFENAILGGGAGTNLLDARQFSGTATLSGEGGIDNLIASKGGGDLYGFHAGATTAETKTKLYTRDNFFASAAATTDHLHATTKAGNILSFRYSPSAVTYTIPNVSGSTAGVGGGLSIELTEGMITAVEGSIFGDHLTGNKKTNFLIGGKGNDVLRAVGFDYLYGGPGKDVLLGNTPFKFQNNNYPIPNSTGVTAVRAPAPFPRPETIIDAISALIGRA